MKIGSMVTWESQSSGSKTTKSGYIVCRIPKGKIPICPVKRVLSRWMRLYASSYRIDKLGGGGPRDHDSYLVAVPGKTRRGRPVLYWPHVNRLSRVERRKKNEHTH